MGDKETKGRRKKLQKCEYHPIDEQRKQRWNSICYLPYSWECLCDRMCHALFTRKWAWGPPRLAGIFTSAFWGMKEISWVRWDSREVARKKEFDANHREEIVKESGSSLFVFLRLLHSKISHGSSESMNNSATWRYARCCCALLCFYCHKLPDKWRTLAFKMKKRYQK